jgi:hypothetical protein
LRRSFHAGFCSIAGGVIFAAMHRFRKGGGRGSADLRERGRATILELRARPVHPHQRSLDVTRRPATAWRWPTALGCAKFSASEPKADTMKPSASIAMV